MFHLKQQNQYFSLSKRTNGDVTEMGNVEETAWRNQSFCCG